MKNKDLDNQDFFGDESESINQLLHYVQSLSPDTIAQLSKPQSTEVFQVMERNLMSLLGSLPADNFNIHINTNRESLGRLLASAMMSGYFLRNAEQRLEFEKSLHSPQSNSSETQQE